MQSAQLSEQLRQGSGRFLDRRRRILALALTASGSMGLISLYQMGILRHIPEPPLPELDADRVDASEEAYEKLQSPDAVIGLASYAVTALLAAAGEPDRARTRPWLPLALAGKIGLDAAQAAKLSWDQWARHRAFCSWCLLAAGATFATIPLAIPEARKAIASVKLCSASAISARLPEKIGPSGFRVGKPGSDEQERSSTGIFEGMAPVSKGCERDIKEEPPAARDYQAPVVLLAHRRSRYPSPGPASPQSLTPFLSTSRL